VPDPSVIVTEGLTKHFGDVRAVVDLDLEIRRGEVFGFLGPNGAGKTTTIRLLLDAIRPTSGTARILDTSPADPAVRRRIGYLPAELHIDPRYTTEDVVALYGSLRGGVDRRRVDGLLERFDLDPTRRVGELSTGNRRKVGVIQAFMHAPEVLILDEPTSGLDPLLQHEFQDLLRTSVRDGATVFLSSHALPEVERVAGRVGIIREGVLVTVAGIDELRKQARVRIEVHTSDARRLFTALRETPGVVSAHGRRGSVDAVVKGTLDAVLKTIARFEVTRLITREADLEEVFLSFYAEHPAPGRRSRPR
jgi:ABC-2 type transport system ATP-binding protein